MGEPVGGALLAFIQVLDDLEARVVGPGVVILLVGSVAPHGDHVPEFMTESIEEELTPTRR